MLITSIDVGVSNLGISLSEVKLEPTFKIVKVIRCDTLNLVKISKMTCKKTKCNQYLQRCYSHYLKHFFEKYARKYFDCADRILIEMQPHTCYVAIEQLINWNYPNKVTLQSPMTLHSYMGTIGKPRPEKKAESMRRALPYICNLRGFKTHKSWRHDMADTVVYVLLWLRNQKKDYDKSMKNNNFSSFVFNNDL